MTGGGKAGNTMTGRRARAESTNGHRQTVYICVEINGCKATITRCSLKTRSSALGGKEEDNERATNGNSEG
jgi:hypothetical protein